MYDNFLALMTIFKKWANVHYCINKHLLFFWQRCQRISIAVVAAVVVGLFTVRVSSL